MSETPEHDRRFEAWKRGENHDIPAAYKYVESILHTADACRGLHAWRGWAIREAFLAGITFAQTHGELVRNAALGTIVRASGITPDAVEAWMRGQAKGRRRMEMGLRAIAAHLTSEKTKEQPAPTNTMPPREVLESDAWNEQRIELQNRVEEAARDLIAFSGAAGMELPFDGLKIRIEVTQ